ncbi:MAG: tyrosine--tRNA ligase [Phycisphaerales bacterium]
MTFRSPFLRELEWRGFIHQSTDLPGLDAHLSGGSRKAYVGFDPTSDSLTIGNLIPIMLLGHFQRAGHTPVVLAGGGTGLIGDPSGKSAERELRTREQVAANVRSQMRIFSRILDFSDGSPCRALVVNNLDWLAGLTYLDALRDIGKHFSVNMMIQKDSVRERLNNREQGISYTEFSYMLLQAYDFAHLHRTLGITLQMGASDQWGNIVAGSDLIWSMLRVTHEGDWETHQAELRQSNATIPFGLTTPLLTKADGGKYGKTESGAVWLTADRTSPFALYQFCLNTADADIETLLKKLTFLTRPEVESLIAEHASNPGARAPHRALARALTAMLHGEAERDRAEAAAGALFSGDVAGLPLDTLSEVFAAAPSTTHPKARLDGEGLALLDLLVESGVCKSKSEARQALTDGSISVNGKKAAPADRLSPAHLLHDRLLALRRGKKNWHLTRWE